MGKRIQGLVPSGDVALFIATPGQSNIQPRIDGALSVLRKVSGIKPHVITTGAALPAELSVIDAYAQSHPETKGYFAVDAGSTQGLAQTIQKQKLRDKDVKGGGYDLTPVTQKLLAADQIDFTIDQQPYLQGFFPIMRAVPRQGVGNAVGHRRRQHGPEVPRQDDGRPVQRHQEPLRGHVELRRRGEGLGPTGREHQQYHRSGASGAGRTAATESRATRPGARELLVRFLTLREGSIIVVTLLAILYFSLATENFFTHANFINLLPYFAPFAILAAGEVMLMVAGEIDLSIGSVYLFAPFMFYEFNEAGLPLVPCLILCAPVRRRGRCDQRRLRRDHRGVVVHHDARDAARAGRPDADHLRRPAGRDAGRRGDHAHRRRHPHRQRARRSCCPRRSTRSGRSRRSSAPATTPS